MQPVGAMINGAWVTRPDIVSVKKAGFHLFTAPKRVYDHPNDRYVTLEGYKQPMFYELEHTAKSWATVLQRTEWLKERDKQEREIIRLEKTL